ncbi:MAG TPA: RpiB/LacA/LacB family sugar-phosphate isomerase [Solirubrobacteraceae bacterium]|nr:RpiB/LacA/LacB family sugar-phosphate isomerase [Solirubrobacteraceae bacterium]
MRISVAADELTGVAYPLIQELRQRGHEPILHGAYVDDERPDWAWACESAARDVSEGRADQAIVLCWTGTGAAMTANKLPGVRAALCTDVKTVEGARRWNDANVLALSLRRTGLIELEEMLDVWFSEAVSDDPQDLENIAHLSEIEAGGAAPSAAARDQTKAPNGEKAPRQPRSKRAAKG